MEFRQSPSKNERKDSSLHGKVEARQSPPNGGMEGKSSPPNGRVVERLSPPDSRVEGRLSSPNSRQEERLSPQNKSVVELSACQSNGRSSSSTKLSVGDVALTSRLVDEAGKRFAMTAEVRTGGIEREGGGRRGGERSCHVRDRRSERSCAAGVGERGRWPSSEESDGCASGWRSGGLGRAAGRSQSRTVEGVGGGGVLSCEVASAGEKSSESRVRW